MKSILVPVEEHVVIQSVFATALLLGRALDGYIEGMAITPNMPPYIASDIAIGDISFLDPEVRRERALASRRLFETFMAAQGVPQSDTAPSRLYFGWRRSELEEDDFVGHYRRAFDITVLGRPSDQTNHPRPPTVEAALFESGRPVLIAPPAPPATLGTTVMIAWNRSTETARTVALAMPLLARAQRIVVTDFNDWGVSGPVGPGPQPHPPTKRPADGGPNRPKPAWARRRGHSVSSCVTGLRLARQGRLHPEPVAAVHLWRGHQLYPLACNNTCPDGSLASAPIQGRDGICRQGRTASVNVS
jgi:hypothetical protein